LLYAISVAVSTAAATPSEYSRFFLSVATLGPEPGSACAGQPTDRRLLVDIVVICVTMAPRRRLRTSTTWYIGASPDPTRPDRRQSATTCGHGLRIQMRVLEIGIIIVVISLIRTNAA